MKHFILFILVFGLAFSGSSTTTHAKAGGDLHKKINKIEQLIQKKKWKEADKEARTLRKLYQKKEWKIQLIGDEDEYESINEGLDTLQAAVKVKDKVQATTELANLHSLLESVYSL